MTAFWITGIALNLVFFGGLLWWAARNWRDSRAGRRQPEAPPRDGHLTSAGRDNKIHIE